MTNQLQNPEKILAVWETEVSWLEAFAEFFAHEKEQPVLMFSQWDVRLNPQRFVPPPYPAARPPGPERR